MAKRARRKGKVADIEWDWSFEGIEEIFGDYLYRSPLAFVRELLQNASDACWEREEAQANRAFKVKENGRIVVDYRDGKLTVTDNGVGMSMDQIKERLGRIGYGLKRARRDAIEGRISSRVIGQYGVGLLAAISKASQVTIETKSCSEAEPVCWVFERGKNGNKPVLRASNRKEIGTQVTVTLKQSEKSVRDSLAGDDLRRYVRECCRILPVRVICQADSVPSVSALWDEKKWEEIARTQLERQQVKKGDVRKEDPLILVSIQSETPGLLEGALFMPREFRLESRTGFLDLYVRRMHICRDTDQLLPNWTNFIRGFVNSDLLERVVSGDAVASDTELLDEARTLVEQAATELLRQLYLYLARNKELSKASLRLYGERIKHAIIDEPGYDLLDALWRYLLFPVHVLDRRGKSTKYLTLPEYSRLAESQGATPRRILVYRDYGDTALCLTLLSITGIPVLRATNDVDAIILGYIQHRDAIDIEIASATGEMADYIVPYTDRDLDRLLETCAQMQWAPETSASSFEPSSIPALYLSSSKDREDDILLQAESRGHTKLILNARNSLIRRLAIMDADDPLLRHVLVSVHNNAFMFTMREFAGDELEKVYSTHNVSLEALLERAYMAPRTPVPVVAAILILDIVGSTYRLACLSFDEQREMFHRFVEEARVVVIENGGFFDKFTGDGLIALFSSEIVPGDTPAAQRARFCAGELKVLAQRFFESSPISQILRREGYAGALIRIGLSYGKVAFGSFGGQGTAVGRPMIEASRLCDSKELHDVVPGAPLATIQFAESAGLRVDEHYRSLGEHDLRGLGIRTVVAIIN